MKTRQLLKALAVAMAVVAMAVPAQAQDSFTSLDLSVSPVGSMGYIYAQKDGDVKIDRRFNDSYLAARLTFTRSDSHRFVLSTEARYIMAKRKTLNVTPREWLAPYAHPTKAMDVAITQYFGYQLIESERWHPELSVGLGLDYLRSDAKIHNLLFDIGFKFKLRYTVKRVGFFVAANALWTLGGESTAYPAIGQSIKNDLKSHVFDCEAGVSFLLRYD